MRMPAWDADETSVRAWDGFVAFWVVFWVVVGAWTGYQIWQLTGLSASTVDSGHALQSAGRALQDLGDVPVIGDKTGAIGDRILATATGIVDGGVRAGQGLRGLSVLIGLAVGIAPAGTVLMLYLPSRLARRREVTAVRTALHGADDSGAVQALLARRAVEHLSWSELRRITSDPVDDLAVGRHHDLAQAELRRLGINATLPAPP